MSVFSSVLEVVSAVAVVHSTTVAVMVVVSMLFLYRRLVGGGIPTPKQGEVSSMCNFWEKYVSLANLLIPIILLKIVSIQTLNVNPRE